MKLDFGCGMGGFQEISDDRLHTESWCERYGGPDTIGIDINPQRIEEARIRITNGTRFMVCNGNTLPFPDNYFVVVHDSGTLHHMPDYQTAIKEIARVTKPQGLLLLKESVDNDPVFRVMRRILGKWQGDHIDSLFTSESLDHCLARHFNIVFQSYYWRFTFSDALRMIDKEPAISLRFNHWLSSLFSKAGLDRDFCSHYVAMAIKTSSKS